MIHCDLTPRNIMVNAEGRVKITDFGLARPFPGKEYYDGPSGIFGNLDYMSPEQVESKRINLSVDIYTIGMTFYHVLTGRLPFPESYTPADNIRTIPTEKYAPPREFNRRIPKKLNQIIVKTLKKDRKNRFHSAEEMAEAVEKIDADRKRSGNFEKEAPQGGILEIVLSSLSLADLSPFLILAA